MPRACTALALVLALNAPSAALAAGKPPLPPGKPAGVQQARLRPGPWAAAGIGVAVVGGLAALALSGKATPPSYVTTTTN